MVSLSLLLEIFALATLSDNGFSLPSPPDTFFASMGGKFAVYFHCISLSFGSSVSVR